MYSWRDDLLVVRGRAGARPSIYSPVSNAISRSSSC